MHNNIFICGKEGGNIPVKRFQELLIKLNQMGFKAKDNGSVLDIPKNPKPEKRYLHICNGKVSFGSPLFLTPNLYEINIDGSIWYEYNYFLNNF